MLTGEVALVADIRGNGLAFPKLDYAPGLPGVVNVELEGTGDQIRCTVGVAGVPSEDAGRSLALAACGAALNRIAFGQQVTVGGGRVSGYSFAPADGGTGVVGVSNTLFLQGAAAATKAVTDAAPRPMLEEAAPAGEPLFGLFRSAMNSTGPVERFLSLYHILMVVPTTRRRRRTPSS